MSLVISRENFKYLAKGLYFFQMIDYKKLFLILLSTNILNFAYSQPSNTEQTEDNIKSGKKSNVPADPLEKTTTENNNQLKTENNSYLNDINWQSSAVFINNVTLKQSGVLSLSVLAIYPYTTDISLIANMNVTKKFEISEGENEINLEDSQVTITKKNRMKILGFNWSESLSIGLPTSQVSWRESRWFNFNLKQNLTKIVGKRGTLSPKAGIVYYVNEFKSARIDSQATNNYWPIFQIYGGLSYSHVVNSKLSLSIGGNWIQTHYEQPGNSTPFIGDKDNLERDSYSTTLSASYTASDQLGIFSSINSGNMVLATNRIDPFFLDETRSTWSLGTNYSF
ncbi:MAG: hypothetical protein CMP10_15385 [Zetaproteobacteria bacterium]|nr:hypothetical protein [Pseudobdellovibrionaceae bacterium]